MTELALITPVSLSEKSLDELAELANEQYLQGQGALVSAVSYGIACGETLIQAKTKVPGEWRAWCVENLTFSEERAWRLIRLATYKDHLPQETHEVWTGRRGRVQGPSLERALAYVKGLPQLYALPPGTLVGANVGVKAPISTETQKEIRRLLKAGVTQHQIAELLGISQTTVSKYSDSERFSETRQKARANRIERRRALGMLRKHKKQEELVALSRAIGGHLEETYSLVRRLAQRMDQAHAECENVHAKAAVSKALARLHEAEDAVAIALRLEIKQRSREMA